MFRIPFEKSTSECLSISSACPSKDDDSRSALSRMQVFEVVSCLCLESRSTDRIIFAKAADRSSKWHLCTDNGHKIDPFKFYSIKIVCDVFFSLPPYSRWRYSFWNIQMPESASISRACDKLKRNRIEPQKLFAQFPSIIEESVTRKCARLYTVDRKFQSD